MSFNIPDFDTELDHHLAIGAVNFPASHGVSILIAAFLTLRRHTLFMNVRVSSLDALPHFSTPTIYSLVDTAPVVGAGNIAYFTSLKLASHDDTSHAMAYFFEWWESNPLFRRTRSGNTRIYREWMHPTPQGMVRKHIPPFTYK